MNARINIYSMNASNLNVLFHSINASDSCTHPCKRLQRQRITTKITQYTILKIQIQSRDILQHELASDADYVSTGFPLITESTYIIFFNSS